MMATPVGAKETARTATTKTKTFEIIKPISLKPHAIATTANIKVASSGGDIESIVRHAAIKYGIDPDYFVHIAMCESGLHPNAVNYGYNENGYPSGLFQHLSGYWPARAAKYGYAGASVFDATANANVTAQMFRDGLQGMWECK